MVERSRKIAKMEQDHLALAGQPKSAVEQKAHPCVQNVVCFRPQRSVAVPKGVDIEMRPLDEDHVRAKITWSEQDVGGGKLVVEITVRNMKSHPKTDQQLRSDAKALAVRLARAFADTIDS